MFSKLSIKKKYLYYVRVLKLHFRCLLMDVFSKKNSIKVDWVRNLNNFGDVLNPLIVEALSGRKVINISPDIFKWEYYSVIGSILQRANKNSVIWGSGFISLDSKLKCHPKEIRAVRGPKTQRLLLQQGIACPEIYGDPALLLPRIYNPKIEKQYKLGIIPHYVDKDSSWLKKHKDDVDVLIIDIQTNEVYGFIDQVLSCQNIISSSLHGIIVADAYSIPSLWVEFSKSVIGNGFKFNDYFLSVGREEEVALYIDEKIELEHIYSKVVTHELNIDLNALLDSAPFKVKEAFYMKS